MVKKAVLVLALLVTIDALVEIHLPPDEIDEFDLPKKDIALNLGVQIKVKSPVLPADKSLDPFSSLEPGNRNRVFLTCD